MAQGVVKWFDSAKGYGFIAPDEGGNDVFVHGSIVEAARIRNLPEGQKVEYEVGMQNGKPAVTKLLVL